MSDAVLPPLIVQMMQPEFYPHPVVDPIQLIQTHISYVLLAGDYAYKVKKPLDFGFLNYTTLALRKHFCEEELRLNQRAAADLYLAVLPISGGDAGFVLEAAGSDPETRAGATVEYTLQMRQFPQDALLNAMFARGELTEALLERLATTIADFHKSAETSDYISSFGEISAIRQAFDENYAQTADFIGGPQTQPQFDATQAYTNRFFAEQKELLTQRREQNWIRACHGDLHLGNICLWQDTLYLFDCIEFNEPFRLVDVMYDIAYVIMDLSLAGQTALATSFLNTYVEQTGDWEGLQVLPLYVSRQSYVRGKVTSFMLNDPAISATEKTKVSDQAAPYYRLAYEAMQPRTGRLFLMAGLSGSGKTTVARQWAKQTGAIHIRSDAVRKHLAGIPLMARGDDELYTPTMTQKTYDRLLDLGVTLAQAGYIVILDAKYDRQDKRKAAIARAQTHTIPLQILHCTAPDAVLRDRVQQRTGDIADATVDVLTRQHFEAFSADELPYVTVLDTTVALTQELAKVGE
ncbi:MAG: AAA family ATPase [Cyanobacteria bacterium J06635_15]